MKLDSLQERGDTERAEAQDHLEEWWAFGFFLLLAGVVHTVVSIASGVGLHGSAVEISAVFHVFGVAVLPVYVLYRKITAPGLRKPFVAALGILFIVPLIDLAVHWNSGGAAAARGLGFEPMTILTGGGALLLMFVWLKSTIFWHRAVHQAVR